ncbi:MAG: hypothetical protein JNM79_24480 [Burkholderiales bacterium]|nr:hypothetical protein [Burkholderiales bacterium]
MAHLLLFAAAPLVLALLQVALGIVFLPFLLLSAGDRSVELARAAMHLRDPACWVMLAPCSVADKALFTFPWASAMRDASPAPGTPEPEPFLPLPSDFTVRHAWFLLWLLWFLSYLTKHGRQGKEQARRTVDAATSASGRNSTAPVASSINSRIAPATAVLTEASVERAPDHSEVRPMLRVAGGSMAHFRLAAGSVSKAVVHRSVEELWYVVAGTGELWRKTGAHEQIVKLLPGISVSIPVGTSFQFRATTTLEIIATTMPPWPGDDEAIAVQGVFEESQS